MKKLTAILLALTLSPLSIAQDAPFDGEWDCTGHRLDEPLRVCGAFCGPQQTLEWTALPLEWTCPDSLHNTPGDNAARCEAIGAATPPLCCPPGTECSRNAQPDPNPDPEPGTGETANASSGGNDNFRNGVLLAGGIVIAGAWLYNTMQPPLPDGLSLKPYAHLNYSGGIPATSAGFRGEYGNWAFSAASVNTRGEWIRPYARVRWSWVF